MSEPRTGEKLLRPRQVTMAGWLIIVGSVAVVLTVFAQVSTLNSLDTSRALEEALSRPPASGLGISVADAQLALRISAMVAGACAAAAAILGWQVLQRSKSARIALAVLALPLFVTGVASGGLLSSVVVASAVMLWLQPARDWFDGRQPTRAPQPLAVPSAPTPSAPTPSSPQQAGPLAVTPEPLRHVGPTAPAGQRQPRPSPLVWACVLTWAMTGLAAGLMALSVLVLLAAPETMIEEITRQRPELANQGIAVDSIRSVAVVSASLIVAWCAIAAALAVMVWRGVSWAHLSLIVSAAMAALLCLVGLIVNPLLILPLGACAATITLLVRSEVRWWLRAVASRP